MRRQLFIAWVLAIGYCGVSHAQTYLCIEEIAGPVSPTGFEDCIEVIGLGEGAELESVRIGSEAIFSNVRVLKQIDKATPPLHHAVAASTRFQQAKITALGNCGGNSVSFYDVVLGDVSITGYTTSGGKMKFPRSRFRWTSQRSSGRILSATTAARWLKRLRAVGT